MGQATGDWAAVRSLLLVDTSQESALGDADAWIVDLSRGDRRATADEVAALAGGLRSRRPESRFLVRIAPLGQGRMDADLDIAMPARPDAIVLPDPAGGACLQRLGVALAVREAMLGLPDRSTGIVAQCGAVALGERPSFAGASPRLVALMWDAALLGGDLGVRTALDETAPRAIVRTLLQLAAAAAGVPAYDTATDKDPTRLEEDCRSARALGYAGKVAAQPSQLDPIHAVFGAAPSS